MIVLPPDLTPEEADFLEHPDAENWMSRGACNYRRLGVSRRTAMAMFFPPKEESSQTATARQKAICATCPVKGACLDFALAHNIQQGIWGGMQERERGREKRRREEAAAKAKGRVA